MAQGHALLQGGVDPFRFLPGAARQEVGDLDLPRPGPLDLVRQGSMTFLQYHRVSVAAEIPIDPLGADGPFGLGFRFSLSFAAALMLGGGLAAGGLYLGGRRTARAAGGPRWAGPVHGAKVALPYAGLAFLLSFLVRQEVPVPGGAGVGLGPVVVRPSPLSALVWPLLLGLVAGAAGGLRERGDPFDAPWWPRVRAALAGGWRMVWVALVLAFVGLLGVAAAEPRATATYFDIVARLGPAGGAFLVLTTAMFVPNMATWIAAGSMGGTALGLRFMGTSCPLLSYARFPRGAEGVPSLDAIGDPCQAFLEVIRSGTAPWSYFLFLLVPLVAAVSGGLLAARRADARTPGAGAAAGALAGVVFAVAFVGLAVVSGFSGSLGGPLVGPFGGGGIALGPDPVLAFALALAWGSGLGAAAGAVWARRRPPPETRDGPG